MKEGPWAAAARSSGQLRPTYPDRRGWEQALGLAALLEEVRTAVDSVPRPGPRGYDGALREGGECVSDQPVFVLGEELQALELAGFETEAEFQELLARHPRMLDFGTLADGRPLRLVLVAREMRVPTGTESGTAYWLDHLFVDADGVPTLVEVKRATDTRIRREVVGQMLDYAANAARYWPAALLQRSFEDTCVKDGRTLEEGYEELLGGRSADEFWTSVEERLAAGQMRLLFVADQIPLELRAIVEFLNRQMRQTDVYAVELTQYRGGEAFVSSSRAFTVRSPRWRSPRPVAGPRGVPRGPRWTRPFGPVPIRR